MSELKLLSCPFCGGEAAPYHVDQCEDEGEPAAFVMCNLCNAQVPWSPGLGAISAWNRRIPSKKTVAKMRKALKPFAEAAHNYAECTDDNRFLDDDATVSVGDLREARAALLDFEKERRA